MKRKRDALKKFFIVKKKALCLIHTKVFKSSTFYSQFWMSWYMMVVGIIISLPGNMLTSVHFSYMEIRINEIILGLLLFTIALFQLFSMTSESGEFKKKVAKLCLSMGLFMSLLCLPVLFAGGLRLGFFVFAYYAFHEARILSDLYDYSHINK
jgi:uncharacterized membrane protein YozB (DUF420 family)